MRAVTASLMISTTSGTIQAFRDLRDTTQHRDGGNDGEEPLYPRPPAPQLPSSIPEEHLRRERHERDPTISHGPKSVQNGQDSQTVLDR
jgi:hypothetical protein